MKITFLVHSLYSLGGTIRTTLNTASALLDRGHDVEIVSVFRRRSKPLFPLDPRLTVRTLVDVRTDAEPEPLTVSEATLAQRPSKVFPPTEPRAAQYHRLADARVAVALRDCDADVIVGTRPGLNVYLAKFAPTSAVRVGQEHLSLDHHGRRLARRLYKTYKALDALVTVSAADAEQYRRGMPKVAAKVGHIPNSVPQTPLSPADGDTKLIIAAGRLEQVKRFDVLLRAFARIVGRHPDWRLRIYGHGKQSAELRELVAELGLNDSVMLMGARTPLDAELVKGSIAAVTSDFEAFGLTIVEAMSCGLPVVATDCPHGPAEIIGNGADGLLTPVGDDAAFAAAVTTLIEDPEARGAMAKAALDTAERYRPDSVAARYERLFTDLAKAKRRALSPTHEAGTRVSEQVAGSCRAESFERVALRLPEGAAKLMRRGNAVELPEAVDGEIIVDAAFLAGLSQGIWTVFVDDAKLAADRIDTRVLVDSRPSAAPAAVVVPFSRNGVLALRVWRSPVYPEVDAVSWHGSEVRATGELVGRPSGELTAEVVSRDAEAARYPASVSVDASTFTVRVDVTDLLTVSAEGTRLWDIRLLDGQRELPVGKVLDDVAQRKGPHRLPRWWSPKRRRVQPYFSVDNHLSLKIDDGLAVEE
ncbi:glycosyltransferase family 4 protein [Stackebrandtia nassauensis]|uniref:glycosyltransferase family 4 protein n=1 Tax=Stackebrandtia nassauensis TaxID=283811 RepID=UPI0001A39CB6|nr:glycosyltransferase family 4 protein [Stackebrandtia nassauensis]